MQDAAAAAHTPGKFSTDTQRQVHFGEPQVVLVEASAQQNAEEEIDDCDPSEVDSVFDPPEEPSAEVDIVPFEAHDGENDSDDREAIFARFYDDDFFEIPELSAEDWRKIRR